MVEKISIKNRLKVYTKETILEKVQKAFKKQII